jgi:[pyruvate, water dikinase]-phosphate phosphotransferase / [pyruvate, water dikinase] kinase
LTRTIFFISDGTGITAEALGRSLLSQFETIPFEYVTIPYVNTPQKAQQALERIKQANVKEGERPIIFTTLVDPDISHLLRQEVALVMDFFQTFINPLENELGHQSSHTVGRSHGVKDYSEYMGRINAVNYALAHDDGLNFRDYAKADVILLGVSRCGKTPTCLYLGLQFGIFAANNPLTEEDMSHAQLPKILMNHRDKLFGLKIEPSRLQKIRQERFPNKDYATLKRCEFEIKYSESLFKQEGIPYLDTTTRSIEEIAAEIMTIADIKRRI